MLDLLLSVCLSVCLKVFSTAEIIVEEVGVRAQFRDVHLRTKLTIEDYAAGSPKKAAGGTSSPTVTNRHRSRSPSPTPTSRKGSGANSKDGGSAHAHAHAHAHVEKISALGLSTADHETTRLWTAPLVGHAAHSLKLRNFGHLTPKMKKSRPVSR